MGETSSQTYLCGRKALLTKRRQTRLHQLVAVWLQRQGLSYKKTLHASEQQRPDVAEQRAQWPGELAGEPAVRLTGACAPGIFAGAMDGELFLAWVRQGLVPTLQPDDPVILDNLATHKVAGVCKAIEAAGARLKYLPPYSPDFNPIENLWSKIKQSLRSQAPRTPAKLLTAAARAFATVTPADCHGFFLHAGYATRFMETL